jgi:ApaG protein
MPHHHKRLSPLRRALARMADVALRAASRTIAQWLAPTLPTGQSEPVNLKVAEPTSEALTQGIRVMVHAVYVPEQSSPAADRYVFAYTVVIINEGAAPAQLRTRHWIITDGHGQTEEVKGPGVVGETPRLLPGQQFRYTSGCILKTSFGTMHGTYQMHRDDGACFDAIIAPFSLASPVRDPDRLMN